MPIAATRNPESLMATNQTGNWSDHRSLQTPAQDANCAWKRKNKPHTLYLIAKYQDAGDKT